MIYQCMFIIPETKVPSESPVSISFIRMWLHRYLKGYSHWFISSVKVKLCSGKLGRGNDWEIFTCEKESCTPHSSSQNPLCLHLHFYWIWEDGAEIPALQSVHWRCGCIAVCPQIWFKDTHCSFVPAVQEGVLCVSSCCSVLHSYLLGNLLG